MSEKIEKKHNSSSFKKGRINEVSSSKVLSLLLNITAVVTLLIDATVTFNSIIVFIIIVTGSIQSKQRTAEDVCCPQM